MELCRKKKILANAGELFIKMCEQVKVEREIKKEMKYWKNLQATKKYQLKTTTKKKEEAADKIPRLTEADKKIKARWAGRKERKPTRKKGIKKIN
jgi:sulfate adenylyltransferase subunit 1 (EFTu-like GTPase family)